MCFLTIQIQHQESRIHYGGLVHITICFHHFLAIMKLFRYMKPQFACINPEVLEKANLSLEKILEDEVVGMAFPVDAHFFDDYPCFFGEEDDIAGRQYPHGHSECTEAMKNLVTAHYGKEFLEPKTLTLTLTLTLTPVSYTHLTLPTIYSV